MKGAVIIAVSGVITGGVTGRAVGSSPGTAAGTLAGGCRSYCGRKHRRSQWIFTYDLLDGKPNQAFRMTN